SPDTYNEILGHRLEELERRLGADIAEFMEYQSIRTAISHLPTPLDTAPARVAERQREQGVLKRRLAPLVEPSAEIRTFLEENYRQFKCAPAQPDSVDLLARLRDRQPSRLAYGRVAADEINYRRFFDVNDLAALSMERPEVFRATHEFTLGLLRDGKVSGL